MCGFLYNFIAYFPAVTVHNCSGFFGSLFIIGINQLTATKTATESGIHEKLPNHLCMSVSHLVSFYPNNGRQCWRCCCYCGFHTFFGSTHNFAQTFDRLAVIWCYFNLFGFRTDSLFWLIARKKPTSRSPQAFFGKRFNEPQPETNSNGKLQLTVSIIDIDAPKPFSAHYRPQIEMAFDPSIISIFG